YVQLFRHKYYVNLIPPTGKEYKAIININIGIVDFAKGEVPDIDPSLVLKEAFNTYSTLFT
ncbi:hypothetical protein, partial [Bacteroides uniformis]|uniref:hypothetical protein n=1 Tax=Bacteroides uniformis TaxID=820 RepID=UPI001C3765F3